MEFYDLSKAQLIDHINELQSQISVLKSEMKPLEVTGENRNDDTKHTGAESRKGKRKLADFVEERFWAVFQNAHIGIAISDIDSGGRSIESNSALQKLLGYSGRELRTISFTEFTHPEDIDLDLRLYKELITGVRDYYDMEKRFICKDGREIWGHLIASLVRDNVGDPLFSVALITDITKRKRAEKALAESDERYRLIFDNAPDAYFITDLNGKFTDGNLASVRYLGKEKEEFLGLNYSQLNILSKDQIKKAEQLLSKAVLGLSSGPDELTLIQSDGTKIFTEIRTHPVKIKNETSVLAIARNVTKRKKAEESFLKEQALRSAIEIASPSGILAVNMSGIPIYVNPGLSRMLGWSEEELLKDMLPAKYWPPGEVDKITKLSENALGTGNIPEVINLNLMRKNGERFPVQFITAPLMEDGLQTGWLVNIIDITEQKRVEKELEENTIRLRRLTNRLHNVEELERKTLALDLHDGIGQNLTALSVSLNIIRKNLSENILKIVGPRLSDSINLVVETTKTIRGMMTSLRPLVLDDYGLIAALKGYIERFENRTGISVTLNDDNSLTRFSGTTESAVFRIIQEVFTNISKHAQASKIKVNITKLGKVYRFTIEDDGIGFDQKKKNRKTGDNGWGIMNMKERAFAINGNVEISSKPGRGTIVSIEFGK